MSARDLCRDETCTLKLGTTVKLELSIRGTILVCKVHAILSTGARRTVTAQSAENPTLLKLVLSKEWRENDGDAPQELSNALLYNLLLLVRRVPPPLEKDAGSLRVWPTDDETDMAIVNMALWPRDFYEKKVAIQKMDELFLVVPPGRGPRIHRV